MGLSGVYCYEQFDDGSGSALFMGEQFSLANGVEVQNIVRFDGQTWAPLGIGMSVEVSDLEVFDDGSGPALYAGGWGQVGGLGVQGVAKWDGSSWSDLDGGTNGTVEALQVHDDGSGPALYEDLNALWCTTCPKPAKNPGAGALVQAQLWYRDPASTSNQTTSLSDAIEFSVEP